MIHILDTNIYSSVVTRETVCIALTMALLHDLKVKAVNLLNAYVTAPNRKNLWTVLGSKFEDNDGKSAIIVRAIYSLKRADAQVHARR